jgi:ribosome-associated translation inhibitor RaiA
MQVNVNTDHNIEGHESLAERVSTTVRSALGSLGEHITRVEVHLSDENSDKKGGADAIRCVMEARPERHPPVAVTHHGASVAAAVDGATEKLSRLIEHTLGRLREQKTHRTDPPLPEERLQK